jgi:hypothetical protein
MTRVRYTISDADPNLMPGEVPDFPAPTAASECQPHSRLLCSLTCMCCSVSDYHLCHALTRLTARPSPRMPRLSHGGGGLLMLQSGSTWRCS